METEKEIEKQRANKLMKHLKPIIGIIVLAIALILAFLPSIMMRDLITTITIYKTANAPRDFLVPYYESYVWWETYSIVFQSLAVVLLITSAIFFLPTVVKKFRKH